MTATARDLHAWLPDHDDRSFHVYPTAEQGWYCFGCGRGGGIYQCPA